MPASTNPLCFLSFRPHAVSLAVRKDAARRRDILSRVNIVKRIKIGGSWKMFSIPRNAKGNYDWNAIADGRYYVEWYVGGTRRRVSAGVTAAQALEVQRRKHHELEGRKLGIPGFETAGETLKKPALHVAIAKYLEQIDALKKPNTHRKYEAVLNRFIFTMSVGLFQRVDLLQVFSDGDVQCRFLESFAGRFKPGDTQFAAFQFMVLAPLYLKCLSGGDASAHTTASAAHVPLDIVAAVGDSVPIVVAFGIAGDGKHLPAAANFDAFDDVDSRQNVSPASRIFADSMGDSTWSKRQKTKRGGRS